jgi:Arc/MetJ-type ribon-helix-helix transcriptional regulator
MSDDAQKQEGGETVITVRLPRGLSEKVEARMASGFSTKSEYIRDLIRRDVAEVTVRVEAEEVPA